MPDSDNAEPFGANEPTSMLNLPYTLANFRMLLAEGAQPASHCTHQQIAAWAGGFLWRYTIWPAEPDISVPLELRAAADLAQEIEMEFDAYVGNLFSLPDQPRIQVSRLRLPSEWLVQWLDRLNQLISPTASE